MMASKPTVSKRVSVRALFTKSSSKSSIAEGAPPPPVFNKRDELKHHRVGSRRASLAGSLSNSNSKKINSVGENGKLVIPPFKPKKPGSTCSAESYIEEIIEDESYDELIIEEEEIIEEEIIMDELPERKITIRFDDFDEMQTILHIDDYTNSEINKSWYKREDYDKMVQSARKAVKKIEEENRKTQGKMENKKAPSGEMRGLEAWSTVGSVKVKMLKETAFEAVWNEQNRQWNKGENDAEKLRGVYITISKGAQSVANDRAGEDERIAKLICDDENVEEKKRRRKLLGKSKAILGKSMRKTAKIVGKTAVGAGKVAVATATLDKRMLKEAVTKDRKRRATPGQITRRPSQSSSLGIGGLFDDEKSHDSNCADDVSQTSMGTTDTQQRKREKLKLLGVVPIPGTQKLYKEDIDMLKKDRSALMSRMPSWESGLKSGKC